MVLLILTTLVALTAAVPVAPSIPQLGSCSAPGALLCNGADLWGLCTESNSVTWMATSDGTSCVCSSPEVCSIVATSSGVAASPSITSRTTPSATSTPAPTSNTATSAPTNYGTGVGSASSSSPSSGTPSTTSTPAPTSNTATSSPANYGTSFGSASSPSSYSPTVPAPTSTPSGSGSQYTQFNGNGSPQDGWPTINQWLAFEALFEANSPIGANCETAFGVPNNQPEDNQALHDALISQAQAAGVPAEFALAITLQESLGCVFVDTTSNAVPNPGLMQDHDGSASCAGQTACPLQTIENMLQQGLTGTPTGPGIKQCHQQSPGIGPAQQWYQAARIYNGGSLPTDGDLSGDSAGTSCYVSDVANRLIGWSKGPSGCT